MSMYASAKAIARVCLALPKTGDTDVEQVVHADMKRGIHLLMENSGNISTLVGRLDRAVATLNVETNWDSWEKLVKCCSQLPKSWCAEWLVEADSKVPNHGEVSQKLTRHILDELDFQDARLIHNLFYIVTGAGPYVQLPPERQASKSVTSLTFHKRHVAIGSLLGKWCDTNVTIYGTSIACDVKSAGPYQMEWTEAGLADKIEFMGTCSKKVAVVIKKDTFDLVDPWSSTVASFNAKAGPAKYACIDFYGDGEGPKVAILQRGVKKSQLDVHNCKLHAIAFEVAQDKEKAKQSVEAGYLSAKNYIGAKRKDDLKSKLKAASVKSAETAKRRKVISLGGPPPAKAASASAALPKAPP